MRTVIIIVAGFVLLGIGIFAGRLFSRTGPQPMILGAQVFIALWLIAAGVNMWIGVTQAGYSVMEELPIFLAIYGLPAAAAGFIGWKLA